MIITIIMIMIMIVIVTVIAIVVVMKIDGVREMGGAPRNPAPRKHILVWIVKQSIRLPLHRCIWCYREIS